MHIIIWLFVFGATAPQWATASSFTRFLDHTWRITVGRTPLDEWSARRKNLYLTKHNIHNRQTSMAPVGFEPTISAGERPQTHFLDRAATGTGANYNYIVKLMHIIISIQASRNAIRKQIWQYLWPLLLPVSNEDYKTFCPMSSIRPVTARPALQL